MTDTKKPAQRPEFAALMTRLNLDEPRAAEYLGVPVFTFRKWLNGERTPSSAVFRLLDVLGTVEALAPALHAGFLPAHVEQIPGKSDAYVGKVRASRKTNSKTIEVTHESP